MISRQMLIVLVYALAFLVVAFAVLTGGYIVGQLTTDPFTMRLMGGCAMICLSLLVVDVILLLGALGVNAIETSVDPEERDLE